MDFAEDVTKTNWGTEFTWVRNNPFTDQNKFGGINKTDALNLTVSVDRPTFINFMNQSRTFFFNSQWFFQLRARLSQQLHVERALERLRSTFTAQTGYFQDRLLPGITWVYDVQSESGAALPSDHLPLHRELLGHLRLRSLLGPLPGQGPSAQPARAVGPGGSLGLPLLGGERSGGRPRPGRGLHANPVHLLIGWLQLAVPSSRRRHAPPAIAYLFSLVIFEP